MKLNKLSEPEFTELMNLQNYSKMKLNKLSEPELNKLMNLQNYDYKTIVIAGLIRNLTPHTHALQIIVQKSLRVGVCNDGFLLTSYLRACPRKLYIV